MAPTRTHIGLSVVGALVSGMAANADGALELRVPDEIPVGQDTELRLAAGPDATGTVGFAILNYSGDTLWSGSAEMNGGEASVTLARRNVTRLEKGSAVVSASLGEETVYAATRIRGRQFANAIRRPDGLKTGDEILITDMSFLAPSEAISTTGEKGKWWLRSYHTDAGDDAALVSVETQDVADPESTLASALELPLDLRGWYEIWVLTYAHPTLGGIDVRLSDEPYFLHCDPSQASGAEGRLVEIRYRAADLTGQSLVFQQPYGTYDSETRAAVASLAGVRLVKLSQRQARRVKEERDSQDVRVLGYDNDGFSYFWKWGVHDEACIARLLEPLRDASADFLNVELGGLGGITIPTPYTELYQMTGHTRHGDYRANEFFRWCAESDTNIVDVLTDRAHELGLRLFVSLMAERSFSRDATMRAHPEWMIKRGPGNWDYALPEVRAYQVEKITWIVENHDIDGFIIDFTRYGHFFNTDEPNKAEHMNQFVRDLRAAVDEVKEDSDCYVALCASFGDESWHLKHWGTGIMQDQGLDPRTWIDEDIFDIIMPEGPNMMDYVDMAKGTRTEVWPRKVQDVSFVEHEWVKGGLSMADLERGIDGALDGGAPGVFMFNHEPKTALGRAGYATERDLRSKVSAIYGLRGGPAVEFTTWHPDLVQANEQRSVLKPLTVVADTDGQVDGEVSVPVRNAFDH
ncbi:MAG TPA: hypothetical protein QGH10_03600, partial [Armatimonadota bacterium]|nr:hypothetical protein [Armatimonadota bacterium]